jgi:hypothetical protein
MDPGFGSSKFGICVLEYSDSIIKVVFADQYERSSFNDMVQKIWEIKTLVGELSNVYIDMANVEYIEAVKQELGDDTNWQRRLKYEMHSGQFFARRCKHANPLQESIGT